MLGEDLNGSAGSRWTAVEDKNMRGERLLGDQRQHLGGVHEDCPGDQREVGKEPERNAVGRR